MIGKIWVTICLLLGIVIAQAQTLQPGFDAVEYEHVLRRCAGWADSSHNKQVPRESAYKLVYRSEIAGLHNRWNLWISNDRTTIVVNLRGTTKDADSWLENFYSAMIPATGTLKLNDTNTFQYKFAADTKATVHVGWTIGACSMLPGIAQKIKDYYAQGIKQVIIEGHSQGGVIAFLVSSHLHYEIEAGRLPADLVIKTYCSAAPKPGNLYYAYDFDYINRGGWAFTVVNAADWVPETPVTVQTTKEVNPTNPLVNVKDGFRSQKFFVRLYLGHIYRKMVRASRKNESTYRKFLGRLVGKQVKRYLPQYKAPEYTKNGNYTRAGSPVILQPDSAYYMQFPDGKENIFVHHMPDPYYYLLHRIYKLNGQNER